MGNIKKLLDEISAKTNVRFKVLDYNEEVIFNNLRGNSDISIKDFILDEKKYKIFIKKDDCKFIPFIEFILGKDSLKQNKIEELLEGKVDWDFFKGDIIAKKTKLILIDVKKQKEVLPIIRDTYCEKKVYVGEVYNRIIIIGDLEEEREHGLSLKDTILQVLGINSYIGISDLDGSYEGFLLGYKEAIQAIEIGKKFKITPEVYLSSDMILEKAVYNLTDEYSRELKEKYSEMFNGFNHELILTLEEIIRCNLSLTKASKNLYVHRNTLMYRIEKIKKETGLDIRNFKEATFLYIIYINNKKINN